VPELRRLVACFPLRRHGFSPRSGHVGFVVDRVALWQVFFEYFGFPCQFSFYQILHTHLRVSSGDLTNRPVGGRSTKWTQSYPTQRKACVHLQKYPDSLDGEELINYRSALVSRAAGIRVSIYESFPSSPPMLYL
jgi:hypothetical protein